MALVEAGDAGDADTVGTAGAAGGAGAAAIEGGAGAVVLAALRAIGDRIDAIEPAAIDDEPDAVHRLRTNVRRLRSVLAVYGPLFDETAVGDLRRAYGEFGRELGSVRDLEVRLQVAERALRDAAEPGLLGTGPLDRGLFDSVALAAVGDRIIDETSAAHRRAHLRYVALQRSPLATERRAALAEFLEHAPLLPPAAGPARPVLAALLAREAHRAVQRASGVDDAAAPARLHAVRKAGRRVRYAAEALTEEPLALFGAPARRLARAGESIHDVLGDHRDQSLFAEYLRTLAPRTADGGERLVIDTLALAAERRAGMRIADLEPAVRALRSAERGWFSR
ncbi:CHAD domain-containing protein [Agromyces sp. NPDC055520]